MSREENIFFEKGIIMFHDNDYFSFSAFFVLKNKQFVIEFVVIFMI